MRGFNVLLLRGATLAAALFAGLLLGKHSGEVPAILEETEPVSETSAGAGETLLKELQRLLLAERDFAVEILFLRWARTDPEGAIVAADRSLVRLLEWPTFLRDRHQRVGCRLVAAIGCLGSVLHGKPCLEAYQSP